MDAFTIKMGIGIVIVVVIIAGIVIIRKLRRKQNPPESPEPAPAYTSTLRPGEVMLPPTAPPRYEDVV